MDQKLLGIAARRAALDAEESNLLRYAEELKLWRGWGFGSMLEYMERAMGYAPHTATERLRVARVIAELPLIAEALEQGELAHSAVRELSRVAVPDTEAAWLEAARGKSLREIEALVSGHRPGHLPTDETEPRLHRKTLTIEVSPETYDLWRKMHALAAEEHGQRLSDDELIPSLFRRAYGDGAMGGDRGSGSGGGSSRGNSCGSSESGHREGSSGNSSDSSGNSHSGGSGGSGNGHDGNGSSESGHSSGSSESGHRENSSDNGRNRASAPAYKIAIKQCPDCKRAWQYSGGRDVEVDPAVAECAACDAVHLGSLDAAVPERTTTTVTARKREQVLARDGHCCTVPGCRRNIGLDLHHIEYQSRGGSHELSNLTTICDLHHRAVHFEKLVIRGTAPDRLTFKFRKPRDRRNVTDDDSVASNSVASNSVASNSVASNSVASNSAASNSAASNSIASNSIASNSTPPPAPTRAASSTDAEISLAGPTWTPEPGQPPGALDPRARLAAGPTWAPEPGQPPGAVAASRPVPRGRRSPGRSRLRGPSGARSQGEPNPFHR